MTETTLFKLLSVLIPLVLTDVQPVLSAPPLSSEELAHNKVYSFSPRSTIVLCSDNPDVHVGRLKRFMDAIFGDNKYAVLDGRDVLGNIDEDVATLVYFGHPIENGDGNLCLSKFASLREFMELKRDTAPRTISAYGVLPDATKDDLLKILATGFWQADKSGQQLELYAAFCYQEDEFCSSSYYPSIFALDGSLCGNPSICHLD